MKFRKISLRLAPAMFRPGPGVFVALRSSPTGAFSTFRVLWGSFPAVGAIVFLGRG